MPTALGQTLFDAIKSSHLDRVKMLLAKGAKVNERDEEGRSVLHVAAAFASSDIVRCLVEAGAKVEATDKVRHTPLMVALLANKEDCALPLMSTTTVRKRDNEGSTPLHYIIARGMQKALLRALECKAVLDRKDRKGVSAYVLALEKKDRALINIIYAHLAKSIGCASRSRYPLHYAASCEPLKIVSCLVDAGFPIEEKDHDGLTPLAHAIKGGRVKMATHLVGLGADIKTKDNFGNSLVHLAQGNSLNKVLQWLICQGLTMAEVNERGETPLFSAVLAGAYSKEAIKAYLQNGADLSTKDKQGNTLLHVCKSDRLAQFLVDEGLPVNDENLAGLTPLQVAQKESKSLPLISFLQSKGSRRMPLPEVMAAVEKEDIAAVRLLLTKGADVNEADSDGVTALMLATYKNNKELVRTLLTAKADVSCEANRLPNLRGPWDRRIGPWYKEKNYGSKAGISALHLAAAFGNLEIVNMLVERGAPLDRTPAEVGTPMAIAARLGHGKVVQYLIDNKSPLERTSESEPLNWAIKGGHVDIVEMLINAGFPIQSVVHARTSVLDVAVQSEMTVIANLLFEAGAKCHDVWFQPTFYRILEGDFDRALHNLKSAKKTRELIDSEGRTALHIAALVGAVEVIEYLIDDLDMVPDVREWLYGGTPLHLASLMGRAPAVKALVERGANECALTKQGFSPGDLACASSFLVGLTSFVTGTGPKSEDKKFIKEIYRLESKILERKQTFLAECDKDYDSYEWKHIGRPIEEDVIKLRNELRQLCSKG